MASLSPLFSDLANALASARRQAERLEKTLLAEKWICAVPISFLMASTLALCTQRLTPRSTPSLALIGIVVLTLLITIGEIGRIRDRAALLRACRDTSRVLNRASEILGNGGPVTTEEALFFFPDACRGCGWRTLQQRRYAAEGDRYVSIAGMSSPLYYREKYCRVEEACQRCGAVRVREYPPSFQRPGYSDTTSPAHEPRMVGQHTIVAGLRHEFHGVLDANRIPQRDSRQC